MSGGYVMLYRPTHPTSNGHGYISEHRYVMEQTLGRFLRPDEVVHHINHIKTDNRPDNLELVTRADHTRHHKPSTPAEMRRCSLEGCDRKHYGNGLCFIHNRRRARTGDPEMVREHGFKRLDQPCVVPECPNPYLARGLCNAHYRRFKREGTLDQWATFYKTRP